MYQLYRDRPAFILAIVLANIVLSIWSISLDSVINNDGITYLSMSQLFLEGDWSAATELYSWPFYPLFIAALSKLFFVDVTTAAHILNTILATSMTLAYVAIVSELSRHNKRTIYIAALLILTLPSVIKYRAYIIRDFGYLSCYLWSLYFLFRYSGTNNKKFLIGWLIAAALSCLFRFEGILLILITPFFLLLFFAHIPHRKKILTAMSVTIAVMAAIILPWYLQDKYAAVIELAQKNGQDINNVFELFVSNISKQFQGHSSGLFGLATVTASNIGGVLYDLIRRMAVFYFFISLFSYWKGWGFYKPGIKKIWFVYLLTSFLILVGFSFINNLHVSRYTMATALTLLILVPFAIDRLLSNLAAMKFWQKSLSYLLLALLVFVTLDGLDVRTKKTHFLRAGEWMQQNFESGATLYSNDRLLVHYAKLGPRSNFRDQFSTSQLVSHVETGAIRGYDYVALSITPNNYFEDLMRQTLWYQYGRPVQILEGRKGRSVFIYQIKKAK